MAADTWDVGSPGKHQTLRSLPSSVCRRQRRGGAVLRRWLTTACLLVGATWLCGAELRRPEPSVTSLLRRVIWQKTAVLVDGPPQRPPACRQFDRLRVAGRPVVHGLAEASGLVASRRDQGVLWAHNDSGGSSLLYALDLRGRPLGTYRLSGVEARDWEDIAIGPGPQRGVSYLYVADIGDNFHLRREVAIHRLPEPAVGGPHRIGPGETLRLRYPDGPRDAETLLVHPCTGAIYVITKAPFSGISAVYRLRPPVSFGAGVQRMERIATLSFGRGKLAVGNLLATGGDISPAGDQLVIRTYAHAFLWSWPPGASLREVLEQQPCSISLAAQRAGEAIAFAASSGALFALGEGRDQPLYAAWRRRQGEPVERSWRGTDPSRSCDPAGSSGRFRITSACR